MSARALSKKGITLMHYQDYREVARYFPEWTAQHAPDRPVLRFGRVLQISIEVDEFALKQAKDPAQMVKCALREGLKEMMNKLEEEYEKVKNV